MKVKLTATKFAQILKVQDICHNLMLLSDEDSNNVCYVDSVNVDKEEFHNVMSCISGSIEKLVEKYYVLFD